MAKQITAYKCEWCNKISSTKSGIITHERNCHSNPQFNCCENCIYAEMKEFVDENDWREYLPYCKKHNDYIFGACKPERPYFRECETADNSYGMREEVPVPYTCYYFESKGTHGFPSVFELLEGDIDG